MELVAVLWAQAYVMPAHVRRAPSSVMCEAPPSSMRMKDLKAELDSLGVTWRGTCFEKEDLVSLLVQARESPPPPPPPVQPRPSPATVPPPSSARFGGFGSAMAQAEAEAAEVNAMSIEEIRAELKELGSETANEDKSELVGELLNARAFARPQFDTSQLGDTGAGSAS